MAQKCFSGESRRYLLPVFMVFLVLTTIGSLSLMGLADESDDDLEKLFRPATKIEQEFCQLVIETLAQAIPSDLEGFTITHKTECVPLDSVTNARTSEPFFVEYQIVWEDTLKKRQADDKIVAALNECLPLLLEESDDSLIDDLLNELAMLEGELEEAINTFDLEKIQLITAKITKLQEQFESNPKSTAAVSKRADEEEQKIRRQLSPHDWKLSVKVKVNIFWNNFFSDFTEEQTMAGICAYRQEGHYLSNGTWEEGYTNVFLGDGWMLQEDHNGSRYMELIPKKNIPPTAVQAIIVTIWGDNQRAHTILETIDWEALKDLL